MWLPNSRFDKELTGGEDRYHHLVLLAENNTGYAEPDEDRQPSGFTEGYYYKPRDGYGSTAGVPRGNHRACLPAWQVKCPDISGKGHERGGEKAARKYARTCFGKGNYFLELQDHGIPDAAHR